MNSDNIISHLSRAYILRDQTSKAGKKYSVLILEWIMPDNKTYTQRIFLSSEQLAILDITVAKPIQPIL